MADFDPGQFDERAAICEYDGGMTRFAAETQAAKEQGLTRWNAIKLHQEAQDAHGRGPAVGAGDQARTLDRKRDENDVPGVQRQSEEEERPVSEREPQDGRDRGALLALRMGQGGAL